MWVEVRDRSPHLQAHHLLSISQPAARRHDGCELPNLLRLQIFSSLATPIMNRCERSWTKRFSANMKNGDRSRRDAKTLRAASPIRLPPGSSRRSTPLNCCPHLRQYRGKRGVNATIQSRGSGPETRSWHSSACRSACCRWRGETADFQRWSATSGAVCRTTRAALVANECRRG